ncbi:hypothetical protein [Streptomyces sp. NPDC088746]|uniref:hypothetical protein n=1 Tax=Streptomyces sp. NPDC088746 TaxID=3365885 RepID=UPI0037F351AB
MSRSSRSVQTLFPVVLAVSLTACSWLPVPPVPGGDPAVLSPARTATTWTDTHGGTLELKPNGAIAADNVCGSPDDDAGRNVVRSGAGTWVASDFKGQTTVYASFDNSDSFTSYQALRDGSTLKLWIYIGDPDNGKLCVLSAPAR